MTVGCDVVAVEAAIHALYVGVPEAHLRDDHRKKAAEVAGLLPEIDRRLPRAGRRPFVLVDAAAGRAPVGLLAARLLFQPRGLAVRVLAIEREAHRASVVRSLAARLSDGGTIVEVREADVADPAAWPDRPDLVVALHACGPAFDVVAQRAVASGARHLLLVPCCPGDAVADEARATRAAEALGVPRHGAVRRAWLDATVAALRTLRLEAWGYETVVVPFVPPTVTPWNLVWRARRVQEPGRMEDARRDLARWS